MSRVLRGGAWYNDPRSCRAANRYDYDPGDRGGSYRVPCVLCVPHRIAGHCAADR